MKAELLDYLLHLRQKVSSTTYRRKLWQIRSFFKWLDMHRIPFEEVQKADVEQYLLSLKCSRSVLLQMVQIIGDFYRFRKLHNPVTEIRLPGDKSKKLPNVPCKETLKDIIGKLSEAENKYALRDRLMVELVYGSGLRRDELRKVNVDDVNYEDGTVMVTGKGSVSRMVPLTRNAKNLLREYCTIRKASRGPLVVSRTGRRFSNQGIYMAMRTRAGIRPHLLRQACATHMLQNGANIRVIQELLGHKDLKSTSVYTHVNKENLREIIQQKHPRNH